MKRKASRKRARADVALHLWAVTVTNSMGGHLWITTRRLNIQAAIAKAERFMRRHCDSYADSQIMKVKNKGTIDA